MTKSLEVISETICDPKHPFRKVDNQPKKPVKHRYERRKIKQASNSISGLYLISRSGQENYYR